MSFTCTAQRRSAAAHGRGSLSPRSTERHRRSSAAAAGQVQLLSQTQRRQWQPGSAPRERSVRRLQTLSEEDDPYSLDVASALGYGEQPWIDDDQEQVHGAARVMREDSMVQK